MDIEKYKKELEGGIYSGPKGGTFYIGGRVVEKVLKDVINEALRTRDIKQLTNNQTK